MSPFQDKKFKDLQATWAKKLKASGFEDAEDKKGNLISHSGKFAIKHNAEHFKFKFEYFSRAGHFLNEHEFDCPLDKEIWSLHVEGLSYRQIVSKCSSWKNAPSKWDVHQAVLRLKKLMVESWKKNQD